MATDPTITFKIVTATPVETRGNQMSELRLAVEALKPGQCLISPDISQGYASTLARKTHLKFPTRQFTTRRQPDGSIHLYRTA